MYEKVWKKLHSWEFYRNNLYTAQRQKLRFLLNGILYVAYEQEICSLLTLRFHKF